MLTIMKTLILISIILLVTACEGETTFHPAVANEKVIKKFLFFDTNEKFNNIEGGGYDLLGSAYSIKFNATENLVPLLLKNKFIECNKEIAFKYLEEEIEDPELKKLFKTKWQINKDEFKYFIYDQGIEVQKCTVIAVKNNLFYMAYYSST